MDSGLFLFGLLVALIAIYRQTWRRLRSPQATVRGLLRSYHAFARTGLPELESLLRVLSKRSGWRNLPSVFLAEIIARFGTKENVFRFVSLAESYRLDRTQLPAIAANRDMETAMREVALWLVDFGNRLHKENSFKQAEFVQKLALNLQPDQYFTNLPLAATLLKMERYDDAAALFKDGLVQLENCAAGAAFLDRWETGANLDEVRARYREMSDSCSKARRRQRDSVP